MIIDRFKIPRKLTRPAKGTANLLFLKKAVLFSYHIELSQCHSKDDLSIILDSADMADERARMGIENTEAFFFFWLLCKGLTDS